MFPLISSFLAIFFVGYVAGSDHKLSKSTLAWFWVAILCSLPNIYKVVRMFEELT